MRRDTVAQDRRTSFRPYARLMLLLGKELVRDDVVAVLELVKNSYDADAERVEVCLQAGNGGYLEVRDDGTGMTIEDVLGKWLAPATPDKVPRRGEKKPRSPKKGRVTLGEKGIGRFATQRVGRFLELVSRREGAESEVVLQVDWAKYEDPDVLLDEVENELMVRVPEEFRGGSGTVIRIRGLAANWDETKISRLRDAVARLMDPFASRPDFLVELTVNGKPMHLREALLSELEEEAAYILRGEFDKQGTFVGQLNKEPVQWKVREEVMGRGGDLVAPCGPFAVEIYVMERDTAELRARWDEFVERLGGITVYRDGFRIVPFGETWFDWLGIDRRRVSRVGHRLSSRQLVGRCCITRDGNPGLIEKSDREGLIENREYEFFRRATLQLITEMETQRGRDRKRLQEVRSFDVGKVLERVTIEVALPPGTKEAVRQAAIQYSTEKREQEQREDLMMDLAGLGLAAERTSHELAYFLGTIRDSLRSLKRILGEYGYPRASELIGQIDGFCLQLERELSGLLPLYRAARRAVEQVDLQKVCRTALFIFRRELVKHGIKASIHVLDPLTIKENSGLVLQVLINLIDNAIYWLLLRPVGQRLIEITIDGRSGSLLVEDSGPGIDEADLPLVFEPFFSRKPDGRGLGLYIVKQQLSKRKHQVEVIGRGRLGGATFRITFYGWGG